MLGNPAETQEQEEEGSALPPAVLKRGLERQIAVEHVLELFCQWLTEEHTKAQDELRFKRDRQRQMAPVVAAVRHLERASELVTQYASICTEVVTLEARYNALESCQLVAANVYEADLTETNTALLFQEFAAKTDFKNWCIQ